MTTTNRDFEQELIAKAHPEKIAILSSFFKTAPGEYGEGDRFIGLTVPENRAIARRYIHLTCDELTPMLHSPIHEIRLAALLCMVEKYKNRRTAAELRQSIFERVMPDIEKTFSPDGCQREDGKKKDEFSERHFTVWFFRRQEVLDWLIFTKIGKEEKEKQVCFKDS